MSIKISSPSPERFLDIASFVSKCDVLVNHDPHFYKIILDYFGDTALMATDESDQIIGFTFGFVSQKDPNLFFLWQIGVSERGQGSGTGIALLERLMERARSKNCKRFRATVLVDNPPAIGLFKKAGFINISRSYKEALDGVEGPSIPNFYGENEDLMVFERKI